MDEYNDIVKEQKNEYLRTSLYAGAHSQPDTEAKLQALAERVGMPVDAVRRKQPEVELHDRLQSFDYEKVIKESPVLSSWLADPKNAAIAHDDIDNLSRTEMLFTHGRDYAGALLGQGVIGGGVGTALSGFGEIYGVAARSLERGLDAALPKSAMDVLRTPIPWWLDPEQLLKRPGGSFKQVGKAIAPPQERQTLGTDVAAGVGQLGFQIGAYLMTGGLSSTSMMFAQGSDIMAEKTANDIADPGLRDTAILTGGAITALTERYGLDKILNRVPPAIRNRTLRFIADKVAAGGIEAAQEFTEGLLHDVARRVLTNKDAELLQGVEREMSAAALSAAIVRSALGVRGHMQATQTENFIKSLADDSKSSRLRERLPERYRDLIAKYTADGPVQQVMIPAEQFAEYFQSVDIDPMQAASDFGAVNFAEAVATGGDVVIPMADFVAKLAPTDHLQGLLQDLRLLPDELTARESKVAEDNRAESDKQLLADIEEINKASQSSASLDTAIQRIVSDVETQLSQRYDKRTANQLATAMRGVAVLAQRANPDADPLTAAQALWDRYGLTVNAMAEDGQAAAEKSFNQAQETQGNNLRVVDVFGNGSLLEHYDDKKGLVYSRQIAPSGKISWHVSEVFPQEEGGNQVLGEMFAYNSLDEAKSAVKGLRISRSKVAANNQKYGDIPRIWTGESKKIAKALIDAGIAIDRFSSSTQSKSKYIYTDSGLKIRLSDHALPAAYDSADVEFRFGGSIDEFVSEALKADQSARRLADGDEDGQVIAEKSFNQSAFTDNENFRKWFGDSKVVAADAQPLVVYHGTGNLENITSFSPELTGKGNDQIGSGFYFTTDRTEASGYTSAVTMSAGPGAKKLGGESSPGVVPVFLSIKNPIVVKGSNLNDTDINITQQQAEAIIKRAPNLTDEVESPLWNWEDISGGVTPGMIKRVAQHYTGSSFIQLENDFFRGNESAFREAVRDTLGYDGVVLTFEDGKQHWVAWFPEQIKSAIGNKGTFDPNDPNILNQPDSAAGTNRGSITIGKDRKISINLFEDANLSTFLHETGHFYLEVISDLAQDEGTSQQVKDDYDKILKFLGVDSRDQIQVEHHEKWARANEAYFMEGKAPSQELRGVFQRFGAWLKFIYKQLAQLNVKLNDDVRGVLDRIYATDEEISRAKEEADLNALFVDAKAAGMTEAEFKIYSDAVAQEVVDGKEALQNQLMRIERLKRESWWKDERAKVAEEVAAEFDATPTAQAFNRLVVIDGEERLNKNQLTERFGEDVLKSLPRGYGEGRGAVYAEDGQDIDSIAEVLGYSDVNGLIDALVNMPNRAQYIAAEADARMGQRHGDLLNSIAIADAAMEALHNDQREKVLRMELRALNKKAREVRPFVKAEKDKAAQQRREAVAATELPPAQAFRDIARGLVGQKQWRDLNPHSYLVAERKANRAAFKAMAKGDHREAQEQKRRELLNHHIYREAIATKQELEKNFAYLSVMQSDKRRATIGKAGGQYLAQMDALLERYEFKNVSQIALQRREALQAWVKEQENEGEAISIPDQILDESRRINWKQASVDELRALTDSVKNIEHLASLKNKLLVKKKALDFERVKSELLESVDKSGLKSTGELGIVSMRTANLKQKGAAAWRKFDAAHMKVEQIVEWLDGGKIDGPWAKYFFDLADHAQTMEYDLHAEVTKKIEALSSDMPREWRHSLSDKTNVRLPGFNDYMKRYDLISAAFNLGNAQNRQRLMDGYGWNDADIQNIINALTVQDFEFVQGVWDAIETLWPHMADLEKRLSGLEPEKVVAAEFEAAGRTWRGGYFPLVYDPKKSNAGEQQANEAQSVQNFVAQGYGRVSTNKGATKKRLEKLNAPVLLDYEQVITSHLSKVIKDISHREAVIGINKILKNEEIKATIIDRLGEAHYMEMNRWLQTLVKDRADTIHQASGLGGIFMKARTNMAIVTMGWKISTMLAQFAGIGQTLDIVKPRFFSKALIESVNAPRETWSFITQRSGEMRHRANTIERDSRDALLRMRGQVGITAQVRRTAFYLTAMADRMVSVPTWIGAYRQARAENMSEEDAIRAGDRAVRLSQGAGGAKDLAAVQRNNELMKLVTMYYSPFNVLYARLRDVGHQSATQGIGYLPKATARLITLVVLPAVISELLGNRGPDEDEDEVWWAIRKTLLYPLATVPVIRDFSGYFEAAIIKASGEGEMKYPPSYKLSPVVTAIEKIMRMPGKIVDAMEGEKEPAAVAWDIFEASGYIAGLPTAQTRITGEYLVDLLSGNEEPENAPELLRDAVFRRQADR